MVQHKGEKCVQRVYCV